MREIKFRGFNRKNGVWLYGFYLQNRGAHFVCPDEFAKGKSWDDYEVDPDTVGQFTGLCDKNGKEIYEGDVVKICYDLACYFNGLCFVGVFNAQFALFSCQGKNLVGYFRGDAPRREVIGSIHDNPELIK